MSTVPKAIEDAGKEAEATRDKILGKPGEPTPAGAAPDQSDRKSTLDAEIAALLEKKESIEKDISTLTGKYGSRLQSLTAQVQEANTRIESLTQENASLKQQIKAAGDKGEDAPKPGMSSDQLREMLGNDFLEEYGDELPTKVVQLIESVVKPLNEKVSQMEAREQQEQQAQAEDVKRREDAFWQSVEREVPNARQLNETDMGWRRWLQGTDPDTGNVRIQDGMAAIKRGDIPAIVALFNAYFHDLGKSEESKPGDEPAKPDKKAHVETPAAKSGGPDAPAPGKKVLTQKGWDEFQREIVQNPGKYSVEEANRINKEYRDALLAGTLQ